MYIPDLNLMRDKTEIVEFMKRFSFATIITAKDNIPIATHLPFLVTLRDDTIILNSHFAKANEHWKDIEEHKILVIFSEPHAYISPKNYDKELNVPTWNYISVHAYGEGKLIHEEKEIYKLLENTIQNYETSYLQQWNKLPEDYKLGMSKGIVGFEILVTDIQAKKKLSQNKTENEKSNIINTLSKSKNANENLIADYMKKNCSE
jgi:transcriptional regulator